ncbi:MAG: sulfatase-like hydrolase/transferase [Planctomycetales bacterium]|nr:sulfatase-like hydrolase/transferase [Planctomycetales bacterium]
MQRFVICLPLIICCVCARLSMGQSGAVEASSTSGPSKQIEPNKTSETKKPNILFIITDQQHGSMMSCVGNPHLTTPSMDYLAKEGIRFANPYVSNPVCVPSRISMATGVMAGRMGVLNNGMRATIPDYIDQHSIGKLLKGAGYDTFYGGKVHMAPELVPANAGYDEYFRDEREALPGACIQFIERPRDRPFFAVASFINPHDICFAYSAYKGQSPRGKSSVEQLYQQAQKMSLDDLPPLPDNYKIPALEPQALALLANPNAVTPAFLMRQKYEDRDWRIYRWIYCRLTEQVDELIGRILDALKRNGLDDKTLIVFTSDHGDMDACHRLASKGIFYDQSVKAPLVICYPGHGVPGQVSEQLVSSGLDVLPTLVDYAGVELPAHVQGKSLRPLLEGKQDTKLRRYVVTENHTGRMLRTDRFKYCVYRVGTIRESLVDLQEDPGELVNLATDDRYQATLNDHRELLHAWVEETRDDDARTFAFDFQPSAQ